MDFATFFGSILGFSLLIAAIVLGGQYDIFFNIPGLMIVVGGTLQVLFLEIQLAIGTLTRQD